MRMNRSRQSDHAEGSASGNLLRSATVLLISAALVCLASPAAARGPGGAEDAQVIRLKAGEFDPVSGREVLTSVPGIDRYQAGARGGFLVQFEQPITAADRAALEAAGASIKGFVPMRALEVVMTEDSRSAVEAIDGVRWVGLYQPGYKLAPGLAAKVGGLEPGSKVKLQVSLFPGEREPGLAEVRGFGARILKVDEGRSFLIAEVEVPAARLAALARVPQVRFIEEVYQRVQLNDRSRVHTGLDAVANDTFTAGLDTSLDGRDEGSGFQVKYGHMDTGLEAVHADFSTATVTFEAGADTSDTDNGHGTHTAGSIVGDGGQYFTVPENAPPAGPVTDGKWRGVTPQAALHHISFDNNYSDQQIFERQVEEGAHISSNSWGYIDAQQNSITDYNTNAAAWDEGVWDADDDVAGQQPLTVFFSAGNNGGWNSPYNGCVSSGPDLIGSPGTAKNVITVANNETDRGADPLCGGAYSGLGDNVEEVNASSSRGPVDPDGTGQGLFKPDVSNIGGYWVASTEASGTASTCSAQYVEGDCPTPGEGGYCSNTGTEYAYYNGTSMSCPLTAGFGGVVLQDLVVNRGVGFPKPSLIKALLINGARDLQPTACDYVFDVGQSVVHQGWGFVQAIGSLYGPNGSPGQRNIELENEETANALATGESYSRQVTVAAGTPLKVTLVWTDYPAAPGAGSPLVVNDLDLQVSGPDGTYLGNNFVGEWSVTGGAADRYNVVENVYLQSPLGGTYTITVGAHQVSQDQEPGKAGVNQDFSLVWSGDLGPCESTCGDGVAECAEICDGADLGGETCQSQGFDDGTLACSGTCDGFDTSGCFDYFCGDGVRQGTEECDGTDLGGASCTDAGCTGGSPSCNLDCTLDYTTCSGCPVCDNDGQCESGEDCTTCTNDCISGSTPGASCGNGVCEAGDGEDCLSCPADCNGTQTGKPSGRFCCGDGAGSNPVSCSDSRCSTGGWECTDTPSTPGSYCCGDLTCEGAEDSVNCAIDCGAPPQCGDGTCDPDEDQCGCPSDCGLPPDSEAGLCSDGADNDCDGFTDCNDADCAGDPICPACDNDGICEPGEDCDSCSNDCAGLQSGKKSGRYCCGDGTAQSAEGNGDICDGNF